MNVSAFNGRSAFMLALLFLPWLASAQTNRIFSFDLDQFGGPSEPLEMNGKLFFSAWDSLHGRELWCTDGTTAGTFMVKDISPGLNGSISGYFSYLSHVHNGVLYFRANDGVTGEELWRSDGTAGGTYLLKEIAAGSAGSSVGEFASSGSYLYFTANTGTQLWRSDGTTSGTQSIGSFQIVRNLCGVNGQLVFSADNSNSGEELWKHNPVTGNTTLLMDLNGVFGASLPCNFRSTGSLAFFMANTAAGWELWKSDATSGGTAMVKDINPGGANGTMSAYSDVFTATIGDTLFFRADDGTGGGFQLWRSDGSGSGTMKISNVSGGLDAYNPFPVDQGNVYISSYSSPVYYCYNSGNGTFGSTNYPSFGYFLSATNKNVFLNGVEYFAAKDSLFGPEIWRADGSFSGISRLQETHLLNNWTSGVTQGFNSVVGTVNGKVLFTLARNPYGAGVPLFCYDTQTTLSCQPPSVIVPVPFSNTSLHLVWNRPEDAIAYEVRYKEVNASGWLADSVGRSFHFISGLDSAGDYRIQVRAWCGQGWTNWSDTISCNTLFTDVDYITDMLSEREEDSTVIRLYWLRSPVITMLRFRYRPVGTSNWLYANSTNGYKRITGLQPNTFYEYNYRENYNGSWAPWSFNTFYFATGGAIATGLAGSLNDAETPVLFPNPANNSVGIKGKDLTGTDYRIYAADGRLMLAGRCVKPVMDVSSLPEGSFLVILEHRDYRFSVPFTIVR